MNKRTPRATSQRTGNPIRATIRAVLILVGIVALEPFAEAGIREWMLTSHTRRAQCQHGDDSPA